MLPFCLPSPSQSLFLHPSEISALGINWHSTATTQHSLANHIGSAPLWILNSTCCLMVLLKCLLRFFCALCSLSVSLGRCKLNPYLPPQLCLKHGTTQNIWLSSSTSGILLMWTTHFSLTRVYKTETVYILSFGSQCCLHFMLPQQWSIPLQLHNFLLLVVHSQGKEHTLCTVILVV